VKKEKEPATKTAKNPNGGGARKIIIDWLLVDQLCEIQCTGEEIASVLDVDYDTVASACKRNHSKSFSDYMTEKRGNGKASLRRTQWKAAEEGSATMQIWLGKNILGQVDKPSIPLEFDLTPNSSPVEQAAQILDQTSKGLISPDIAQQLINSIASTMRIKEVTEIAERLEEIEKMMGVTGG